MTSQTDTFGDSTSMTYDKGGNVKTQTDAKGIVTTMGSRVCEVSAFES
ncbi:MAG: RHS repeat protein [Pirellulaceae bacterium]|nr:RHS repeat protein [Pirellulaceae bacterium]